MSGDDKNEEILPLTEDDLMAVFARQEFPALLRERATRTWEQTRARVRAAEEEARARAGAGGVPPRQKYYFSVKSRLIPVTNKDTVGFEVPEGIRLHVQYDSQAQVATKPQEYAASWPSPPAAVEWAGITGTILSGGDWVLIQKNGVARFDARVTIKTNDNVLIDAIFTGAVDLRGALPSLQVGDPKQLGPEVYRKYLYEPPETTNLPVSLSVRFEAAEQPYLRPGEDDTWIAKSRYAKQRRNFPKYQRLMRGLFFAKGSVTLESKPRWPPTEISLDIFELN